VLCRLVCVIPGAMMYKDIHICITYGAQFVGLPEQSFPSTSKSLLEQLLGASPSGYVAFRHASVDRIHKTRYVADRDL
jgi:hypothetical protein